MEVHDKLTFVMWKKELTFIASSSRRSCSSTQQPTTTKLPLRPLSTIRIRPHIPRHITRRTKSHTLRTRRI